MKCDLSDFDGEFLKLFRSPLKSNQDYIQTDLEEPGSEWALVYGGEDERWLDSILQTYDHGFLLAGHYGGGTRSCLIIKLSAQGILEWQRVYDSNTWSEISVIEQTKDGGYIIAGYIAGYESGNALVFKLSFDGIVEWARSYDGISGDFADCIQQTKDGNYILMGQTGSDVPKDLWVIKLTEKGDIEWQRSYGGLSYEGSWPNTGNGISTIQQTNDGGYIVATETQSFGAGWSDLWLLKLSPNGDIEWQRTYGGEESERLLRNGPHVRQTDDGGYVLACYTLSFGAHFSDIWILKLTSAGDIEWQRLYGRDFGDGISSICIEEDNGYVVAGNTGKSSQGSTNFWLFKISKTGEIKWQRIYEFDNHQELRCMCSTDDDGYVMVGNIPSRFGQSRDALILKVSSMGRLSLDCGNVENSNANISLTYITPLETDVIPVITNGTSIKINLTVREIQGIIEVFCWSFNQPPEELYLKREVNRSLFRKEAFHSLVWTPNRYNNQFEITEYRVYRKFVWEEDKSYQLIGTVPISVNTYVDGYLDLNDRYQYVVTSVDKDGRESSRSEPVGN